jgi:Rrf2 family nitric oxide-sensitive transcriptional repressor
VAARCNTSESHLAQIINQLAQLGYLSTQRGRGGGIMLGRPANQIVIGEVFRSLEADLPVAECFADVDNTCPLIDVCRLRQAIADAAESFFARLDDVTLGELVCGNAALIDMLAPQPCLEHA